MSKTQFSAMKKSFLAVSLIILTSFYFFQPRVAQTPSIDLPRSAITVDSFVASAPKKKDARNLLNANSSKALFVKTILQTDNTWGYDIFDADKLLIHQPHIPAMSGNIGFTTVAQAERVAAVVVTKMQQGESLPTMSAKEIQALIAQ
jgi:Domain of unknown function (DUF4907)